jgi:hypothetical protein
MDRNVMLRTRKMSIAPLPTPRPMVSLEIDTMVNFSNINKRAQYKLSRGCDSEYLS